MRCPNATRPQIDRWCGRTMRRAQQVEAAGLQAGRGAQHAQRARSPRRRARQAALPAVRGIMMRVCAHAPRCLLARRVEHRVGPVLQQCARRVRAGEHVVQLRGPLLP